MNSLDFRFWLWGYFELSGDAANLSEPRVKMIREHIELVRSVHKDIGEFISWLEGFLDCLEGETTRLHKISRENDYSIPKSLMTDKERTVVEVDRERATSIVRDRLQREFGKVTPPLRFPDGPINIDVERIVRDLDLKQTCAPPPPLNLHDQYNQGWQYGPSFPNVGGTKFCVNGTQE